jgi:hypothetical protein
MLTKLNIIFFNAQNVLTNDNLWNVEVDKKIIKKIGRQRRKKTHQSIYKHFKHNNVMKLHHHANIKMGS